MGKCCEKVLWESAVGKCCEKVLWESAVGKGCNWMAGKVLNKQTIQVLCVGLPSTYPIFGKIKRDVICTWDGAKQYSWSQLYS